MVVEVFPRLLGGGVLPKLPPLSEGLQVSPGSVVGDLLWSQPFVSQRRRISILEHSFKLLEDAHVNPLWRRLVFITVHRLKQVVKDNVSLGADVAGAKVSDQSHILCMHWRHSKVLHAARSWVPLGDLPSSLSQLGLQNVTG